MNETATQVRQEACDQLRRVIEDRNLATVFQPIFGFREGRIVGYEALVRGPAGSRHAAIALGFLLLAGILFLLGAVLVAVPIRAVTRRSS